MRENQKQGFAAAETHGVALRTDSQFQCDSEQLGWRSIYADVSTEYYDELPLKGISDPAFGLIMRGAGSVDASFDGEQLFQTIVEPRRIFFAPPGQDTIYRRLQGRSWETLHIYLRKEVVDAFLDDIGAHSVPGLQLLPRAGLFDPLLEQLALNVLRAMQERPVGHALYVDCLAQAIAAHLVQHHSTLTRPPRLPKPDGLTDYRLRRLIDHIEAHLGDDLALDGLGDEAGLSPLYLSRAFKRGTGETIHQYLVRRRIERAKELLTATNDTVAEIAAACGFCDQAHLARWFKRLVGVTPSAWRSGG